MPDLNQFPVPRFTGNEPYHYLYDNLPLDSLIARDAVINDSVDEINSNLIDSAGTAGSLPDRLNVSLNQDGTLKTSAVDASMHGISNHNDDNMTVSSGELNSYIALGFPALTNPVDFVRMLAAERTKLSTIADNATNSSTTIQTNNNGNQTFATPFTISSSPSIEWEWVGVNNVRAVIVNNNPHLHFYEVIPTQITSLQYSIPNPPFLSSTLKVFVNGVRLLENQTVPIPTLNQITSEFSYVTNGISSIDNINGLFTLAIPLSTTDLIAVDYDKSF